MAEQDTLHDAFLRELSELEHFRISYVGRHSDTPLHGDDPDIQRLIEALAMFSARTRLASERSLHNTFERLFLQQFPYLLTPMPAMGLVEVEPNSHLTEVVSLPSGEALELAETGAATKRARRGEHEPPHLRLTTTRPLRIYPAHLTRCTTHGDHRHSELRLHFRAATERSEELDELYLYLDHTEFAASLNVFHALRRNLRAVTIEYGQVTPEAAPEEPCEFSFGMPERTLAEHDLLNHPLQRLRSFFHFPEQELFLGIRVPKRSGKLISHFVLKLDLGGAFPRELRLTQNTFRMNVSPIANVHRAFASPVEYDATQERLAIRYGNADSTQRVLQVLAAYRISEKSGLVPLVASALTDGADAYDVDHQGRGLQRRTFLRLSMPEAFTKAQRVVVEALWDQPKLSMETSGRELACTERSLPGVRMSLRGVFRAPADAPLSHRDSLLTLLGLRNRPLLQKLEELKFLLECVGASSSPLFRPLVSAMRTLVVEPRPSATGKGGYRYHYAVGCEGIDRTGLPALDLLGDKLLSLLMAWNVEEVRSLDFVLIEHAVTLSYGLQGTGLGEWQGGARDAS